MPSGNKSTPDYAVSSHFSSLWGYSTTSIRKYGKKQLTFRNKTLKVIWIDNEQCTEQEIKRYFKNVNQQKEETQLHFSA